MVLRTVFLGLGALATAAPAAAQQPSQAEIGQMAVALLRCNGTLGSLPKIANRQMNERTAAYAEFAGGIGGMIADEAKLTKDQRARAMADGAAMIRPPHSEAEIQAAIKDCLTLVERLRTQMNDARAKKK